MNMLSDFGQCVFCFVDLCGQKCRSYFQKKKIYKLAEINHLLKIKPPVSGWFMAINLR